MPTFCYFASLGGAFLVPESIKMPNEKNLEKVESLREKVKKAKSITFVDYLGLEVNEINDLRAELKKQDAETEVAKNTLLKRALTEEGIESEEITQQLKGPTAVIFSYSDPVAYLKSIYVFAKNFELPEVKFSLIAGAYTSAEKVKQISELPSREELLARMVGGFKTPLTGLVNVLGGGRRNLVTVLSKIAEKKGA